MPWGEAVRLVRILRADPSSMLAASVEGWGHPVSRVEMVLMDLYDVDRAAAGDKKWKGYPRPWDEAHTKTRHGNAAGRTPEQIKALLHSAHFGHPESPV